MSPHPTGPGPHQSEPGHPGFGQPSGPAYGGPGGYPGQGGEAYGPIPPGQVQPNHPGPYGPGAPGQPMGPYGPLAPGQGPGGPMGPGGPLGGGGAGPSGKPNSKLLLVVSAAVLAFVVLAAGAVALVSRGSTATAGGSTDPGGSGAQTSAPAAPQANASAPADAVRSYLWALAAGQASTALALSSEQPADKTFLTDAVLADSNARAPITKINVPPVSGDYVYSVDATYNLGDEAVTDEFNVTKVGNAWKIRQGYVDLDLKYVRNKTLPLNVNKVPVKTDKIRLFPGSYNLTSGSSYITYGSSPLLIKSPSAYASALDSKPTLTQAGEDVFVKAVVSKLTSCAKSREMDPSGCPNRIQPYPYQKVDKSTVKWSLNKDSIANLKPELDYDNPAVAEVRVSPEYEFAAKGTNFGRKATFTRTLTQFGTAKANLTEEPLRLTFSR